MDFTTGFIVIVLVVIFGVDLWLLVKRGYKHTVSAVMLRLSQRFPIIPLLIGIVIGHLFWPNLGIVKEAEERCAQESQ